MSPAVRHRSFRLILQSFDSSHPFLHSHAPFTTIAEEEAKAAKRAAKLVATAEAGTAGGPSGASKGKGKEISIEELWKPSGAAASFWEAAGIEWARLSAYTLSC